HLRVERGKPARPLGAGDEREYLIGSSEEAYLCCFATGVAARHCVVVVQNDKVFVRELAGDRGTFVNGRRVAKELELEHLDVLQVGPLRLTVEIYQPSAADHPDVMRHVSKTDVERIPAPVAMRSAPRAPHAAKGSVDK